jgi:hypothetical protein
MTLFANILRHCEDDKQGRRNRSEAELNEVNPLTFNLFSDLKFIEIIFSYTSTTYNYEIFLMH